jgi:hypothetical protein
MRMKLLRNLRGVLTSRRFFFNWWILPLKFIRGANTFEVRCSDGGISSLIVLSIGGL